MVDRQTEAVERPPSLLAQLREDRRRHWNDWRRPGFQALAVYRLNRWAQQAGRARGLAVVGRCLRYVVRRRYDIDLHPTARLGRRLLIGHQGGIAVGAGVQIGDDCVIKQGVRIGVSPAAHAAKQGVPVLCDRVKVGTRAVINGSVRVGDDARIGPNAVVTSDVPPGAAVIAPPVRLSRKVTLK